jgi:hypothetical protein
VLRARDTAAVLRYAPAAAERAAAAGARREAAGLYARALRFAGALELAGRVRCRDATGDALNIVGTVQLRQGNPDGLAKLDRSRDLARQAGGRERKIRAHLRQLKALGLHLTVNPAADLRQDHR